MAVSRLLYGFIALQAGVVHIMHHDDFQMNRNVLSWYTDAKDHDYVAAIDKKAQEATLVGTDEAAYVSYTNTNRDDPLEYRYKGSERIARLKALKSKYDPTGVFTKQLL